MCTPINHRFECGRWMTITPPTRSWTDRGREGGEHASKGWNADAMLRLGKWVGDCNARIFPGGYRRNSVGIRDEQKKWTMEDGNSFPKDLLLKKKKTITFGKFYIFAQKTRSNTWEIRKAICNQSGMGKITASAKLFLLNKNQHSPARPSSVSQAQNVNPSVSQHHENGANLQRKHVSWYRELDL